MIAGDPRDRPFPRGIIRIGVVPVSLEPKMNPPPYSHTATGNVNFTNEAFNADAGIYRSANRQPSLIVCSSSSPGNGPPISGLISFWIEAELVDVDLEG
jgi:hypothetical protein